MLLRRTDQGLSMEGSFSFFVYLTGSIMHKNNTEQITFLSNLELSTPGFEKK